MACVIGLSRVEEILGVRRTLGALRVPSEQIQGPKNVSGHYVGATCSVCLGCSAMELGVDGQLEGEQCKITSCCYIL